MLYEISPTQPAPPHLRHPNRRDAPPFFKHHPIFGLENAVRRFSHVCLRGINRSYRPTNDHVGGEHDFFPWETGDVAFLNAVDEHLRAEITELVRLLGDDG